jgi:tetratricopeptide (TPR) repeat protein
VNILNKRAKTIIIASVVSLTGLSMTPALVMARDRKDEGRGQGHHRLMGHHGMYWKLCKTDKVGFNGRVHKKWLSVESFQAKYAKTLERLDKFVADNNLTVENAVALKAAIATAAANVETEINALKAIKDSVNCEDPESVEANTEAFKAQLTETKQALKDYKTALKAYKQAIKAAAEAVNSENQ